MNSVEIEYVVNLRLLFRQKKYGAILDIADQRVY